VLITWISQKHYHRISPLTPGNEKSPGLYFFFVLQYPVVSPLFFCRINVGVQYSMGLKHFTMSNFQSNLTMGEIV
jgi:hypothetical protein